MKCQSSNKLNENRADKLLVPQSTLSPASSTNSSFAHRDPAQAKHTLQTSQLMGWELLAAAMNTVDLIHRRLEISPLENV